MTYRIVENEEDVESSILQDYHLEEFELEGESQERMRWFSTEE